MEKPEVADAVHDGFHFGPGTYFTDGSKLYPDPRHREVGLGFCSVTADLQLRTRAYGPVTLDNATVPVAELQSSSWLRGLLGPSTSTPIASMCVLAKKQARAAHGTRRARHILDQIAASFVETSGNGRDLLVQSPHHLGHFPPVCDDTRDFGGQCCG